MKMSISIKCICLYFRFYFILSIKHKHLMIFRTFSTSETGGPETAAAAAALTIFYNGTVSVFKVPPHQKRKFILIKLLIMD
ncbi:hypothetical protein LguiA_000023 [Lonicera macranthoides]